MTPYVFEFVKKHKDKLQGKVLEIGSYNINGTVRDIVDISLGVDLRNGPGVDLVCPVEDLKNHVADGSFDAVVSTETLEHCRDWKAFVRNTWDAVKEGGWLVITMAHWNNGRHDYPSDYQRFSAEQIRHIYKADILELGKPGRPISIGWVVQKAGELGDLNINPVIEWT